MRLGLFGGTFDPPHQGHLAVCLAAQEQLRLDRVEVTPCRIAPHGKVPLASALDRYAMVTLLTQYHQGIVPSPRELTRQGTSYTVETLEELAREMPSAEIFLIIGGDSYDDLPNWREARLIETLAHLAVISRPGSDGLERLREQDRERVVTNSAEIPRGHRGIFDVTMTPCPWSARTIRKQLLAGEGVGDSLDPAVMRYLRKRGLYQENKPR